MNLNQYRIKSVIKSNSQILKNMTWLTGLQIANYLIPLLIIPYIVRTIGADLFGKVSYAQNIITYFTLLINFGFEYSATRAIATNKGDKKKISLIFWSVLKQKTILLFVSFVGLCVLFFTFNRVKEDFILFLFVYLINIGIVLFPTWFFQGVEEMGKMSIFNFTIKLLGLIFTFILVKSASDYLIYPLILSLSYILCGVIALLYVKNHYNLVYQTDKVLDKFLFRESAPIFFNNLFVSLYTVSNVTIFGLYYSDYDVGQYMGVYKIIMAILMLTSMPVNISLFPRISAAFEKSVKTGLSMFKKALSLIVPFSIIVSFVTFVSSGLLVKVILGNQFLESVRILQYLSVMPLLVIVATMLTVQGLYGMKLQRFAPYVGFSIGLISVVINFIFIPKFGINAVAFNWIIAQVLEILIVGVILYRKFNKATL